MDSLTFIEMIAKSYAFNAEVYYSSEQWKKVQELYLLNMNKDEIQRIPKKIHQIWVGSPVPNRYRSFMDSWTHYHPDWEYNLWTDKNCGLIKITSKDLYDKARNPAMRSDILRYEILRQQGGLYVDTDFECLKPFDDLLYLDFFTGISYDSTLQLYNGLIASIPEHPILNDCVVFPEFYDGHKGSRIIATTGAYHFTKCFLRNATQKTIAFPMDYFYPYPNSLRDSGVNPYGFVTDDSYAIHHWAVSWIKKNRHGS